MKRIPRPILTITLLCTTFLAPPTVTLFTATPTQAKQQMERPDGAREGDPEAWDNPRWIDRNIVAPLAPGKGPRADRRESVIDAVIRKFKILLRDLRK